MPEWVHVRGVVAPGYQVASGQSVDSPYPEGTIRMQQPFFAELGLDLSEMHPGTLNISIAPRWFTMHRPRYTFRHVEWTHLHPPEHFSFSPCRLVVEEVAYTGWVYYPHPETKARNFSTPNILEVLAPRIAGVCYGMPVRLLLDPSEITISGELCR